MTRLGSAEATSYAGAITSIVASLTLTDVGVIIGIATAIATFWLNKHYSSRKDRREQEEHEARNEREQEEHEARMKLLEGGVDVHEDS